MHGPVNVILVVTILNLIVLCDCFT